MAKLLQKKLQMVKSRCSPLTYLPACQITHKLCHTTSDAQRLPKGKSKRLVPIN